MEKVKCTICNGEYNNKMFMNHIRVKHRNEFNNDSEMELFGLYSRFKLNDKLVNKLIDEYSNDGSVHSLVKKYCVPDKSLRLLFKLKNVKIKTSKEIANQKSVREKIEKTWLTKYGVNNISKSKKIKEKKRNTFIEKYGVDNIFKTEEFKDLLNTTMLEKYGVKRIGNWNYLTDKQKGERIKKLNSGGSSKLEKRIGKILLDMDVKYEPQYQLKNKIYDYYIKNTNILIEVNGDFWHANPLKYKPKDLLPFPNKPVLAESLWKKDEKKLKIALNCGYKVLYLWEMDINKLSDVELELYINEKINKI